MTLLHQAAQKAVERIRHTLMTGLAHNDAIAALGEIVAMLPQHPDPETRPSMSMFASAADYNAAMDEWLTPPALQHQEVPREPVALTDGIPDAEAAMAYALKRWGYKQGTSACVAFYRGACWLQLAASPSTTRQQEVGSRKQLTEEQIILATEHISMERPGVFVYVARAIERAHGIGVAAAPSTPENAGGVRGPDEGLRKLARHFNESPKYTVEGALRAATGGVLAIAPAQPLPGVETLRNVIECLRADARYVDEEGEATDQLQDLLDALRTAGVPAPESSSPLAADLEMWPGYCQRDYVWPPSAGVQAPAALRLPEPRQLPKMDASYSSNSTYFRGLGWNECLGEVKRLNADGVKEVPVAQP